MFLIFSMVSVMSHIELYTDIQLLELRAVLGTNKEGKSPSHDTLETLCWNYRRISQIEEPKQILSF